MNVLEPEVNINEDTLDGPQCPFTYNVWTEPKYLSIFNFSKFDVLLIFSKPILFKCPVFMGP